MSELKTKANDSSVSDFIGAISDDTKQRDCHLLIDIFSRATGENPKMWGSSVVGFGRYHYKSERSTQEGDWMLTGFSPRKQNLSIYIMDGFDNHRELLGKLGKHKISVGCLYINKLSDIDVRILESLINKSYISMKKTHHGN